MSSVILGNEGTSISKNNNNEVIMTINNLEYLELA